MSVLGSSVSTPPQDVFLGALYFAAFCLVVMTPVLLGDSGPEARQRWVRRYLWVGMAFLIVGHVLAVLNFFWIESIFRVLGHYLRPTDIAEGLSFELCRSVHGWLLLAFVLAAVLLALTHRKAGSWLAMALGLVAPTLLLAAGSAHSAIQWPQDGKVFVTGTERPMQMYELLSPILVWGAPVAVGFVLLAIHLRGGRACRWGPASPEERRAFLALAGLFALAWGIAAIESRWLLHLDRISCRLVAATFSPPPEPVLVLPVAAAVAGFWALVVALGTSRRGEAGRRP